MNLQTIPYTQYEEKVPQEGQHILAQYDQKNIVVYQAFNPRIARYAVENQQFGGEHYRFSRMSWIKPNFLWMMYRCGWATKEEQKRVLAVTISQASFETILEQAVVSSYKKEFYDKEEQWKDALANSNVRLQWDPDHDPYGNKLERRAIQLGLRGDLLEQFGTEWIVSIEDITDFVLEQGKKVQEKKLHELLVIQEAVYTPKNPLAQQQVGLVM